MDGFIVQRSVCYGKRETAEGSGELDGKVTDGAVNLTLLAMMIIVTDDAIYLFTSSIHTCVLLENGHVRTMQCKKTYFINAPQCVIFCV